MKKTYYNEFPNTTANKHLKDVPLDVDFISITETTVVIGCQYAVYINNYDDYRIEFFENFVDVLDYLKKVFAINDLSGFTIKLGS
ncbi:hypothetical protein [Neobacillus vireti]|uniref:hypothetical protein n=1 Tax=Neobacillus vireti TaxID=220686 RepID=UPI002FFEA397